jgi:hypothetical protein
VAVAVAREPLAQMVVVAKQVLVVLVLNGRQDQEFTTLGVVVLDMALTGYLALPARVALAAEVRGALREVPEHLAQQIRAVAAVLLQQGLPAARAAKA